VNLFAGMSQHEIVSSILGFVLFNGYVVLLAVCLAAFWVSSRPRRGRVRSASLWHMGAALWIMLAFVSTVWAAPVEKSFVNPEVAGEPYFSGDRFAKVLIGLGFAAVGVLCMVTGAIQIGRQKREAARKAVLAEAATGAR
jgi:hypothetical protein